MGGPTLSLAQQKDEEEEEENLSIAQLRIMRKVDQFAPTSDPKGRVRRLVKEVRRQVIPLLRKLLRLGSYYLHHHRPPTSKTKVCFEHLLIRRK